MSRKTDRLSGVAEPGCATPDNLYVFVQRVAWFLAGSDRGTASELASSKVFGDRRSHREQGQAR